VIHDDLKNLYEHQARTLSRRPSLGRASARSRVHLVSDTKAEARSGLRVTEVELPTDDGGTGDAPHPGELMRACLGSALVLGYRVWAARLGIPVTNVEVDVTSEFDSRGALGLDDDIAIGWERIVFDVRIESNAPTAEIEDLVIRANRLCPMLANLTSSITRVHNLTVVKSTPTSSIRKISASHTEP
jgi:uncharacterized OsmC-like protein